MISDTPRRGGEGGQKRANCCGRPLWMAPYHFKLCRTWQARPSLQEFMCRSTDLNSPQFVTLQDCAVHFLLCKSISNWFLIFLVGLLIDSITCDLWCLVNTEGGQSSFPLFYFIRDYYCFVKITNYMQYTSCRMLN